MAWDRPTICACRLCFHQLRRVKPRQRDRQPLPLDAAVLQTIVPGTMRQQDSRTRERICTALRTPGNAYLRTFEALESLLPSAAERQTTAAVPMIGTSRPPPPSPPEQGAPGRPTMTMSGGRRRARTATSGESEPGERRRGGDANPLPSPPPSPGTTADAEALSATTTATAATKHRMETWWNYNLQTECFSHKAIARHVRRCGL